MYWKQSINGYVTAIGTGKGSEEITETQYNEILSLLQSRPIAEEGFDYRLTADLQWELYEVPIAEESDEITDEEALDILLGGAV